MVNLALAQINSEKPLFTEGKLVFDIHYLDTLLVKNPIVDASFPKELIYILKGNDYRTEIQSDYTHSSIIGNLNNRNTECFIEVLGKKLELHTSLDTLYKNAFNRNIFNMVSTGETKFILGYPCKKILIHYIDPYMKDISLFYTEKIPNIPSPYTYAFSKIPGMILEIDENFQGIPIELKARTVQNLPLNPEYFEFPTGYFLVSTDDFISKVLQP